MKTTTLTSDKFDHHQLKQKFLSGQEDRYMFGNTDKHQHGANTAHKTDVNVHTLELNHIPSNVTVDDIKRSLQGNHLVSVQVDADNVKNVNTGKGKISFRSNTAEGKSVVQNKLKEFGIESKDFQHKNKEKTSRVGTSAVSFLDSRNEIDLSKGKTNLTINQLYQMKSASTPASAKKKKKVTGKVGENLFLKPKDVISHYQNDTKAQRVNFYESHGDLFGTTNGSYAKVHNEKLAMEKANFEKGERENRLQHQLAQDWTKMQKRFDMYASNRALKPTITRYGKNYH